MQISHIIEKEMDDLEGGIYIYSLFFYTAAKVRLSIVQFFSLLRQKINFKKYFRVFSSFKMTSK